MRQAPQVPLALPLGRVLRQVGPIDCIVGDLRIVDLERPLSFRLVGGSGEWVGDDGAWTGVSDAEFTIHVGDHPWIVELHEVLSGWQAAGTRVMVAAAATVTVVHDGTCCVVLPRTT